MRLCISSTLSLSAIDVSHESERAFEWDDTRSASFSSNIEYSILDNLVDLERLEESG